MELRQIQYFIKVVESGSMGKAAMALDVTTSTLSQQISKLESELSTRLLQRQSTGVIPTGAGLEFLRHARAICHHVEQASSATRSERLSGKVSIGMAPTTALKLALPLLTEMRKRYPKIKVQIVEGLSAHLTTLLDTRRLDMSMRFDMGEDPRMSALPLLKEKLFVIGNVSLPGMPRGKRTSLEQIADLPLILPTGRHTLVSIIINAFNRKNIRPNIVLEIDGLNTLMSAVQQGMGATIHPSSAMALIQKEDVMSVLITDESLFRCTILTAPSDEELSPAALATRVVLKDVVRSLIQSGGWDGAVRQFS